MVEINKSIDEEKRLKALFDLKILDTNPEDIFDNYTKMASEVCEAKIAAISFVDGDRQWFKSKIGLSFQETSRANWFCEESILKNEVLEKKNFKNSELYRDNLVVSDNQNLQFYVSVPLVSREGYIVGFFFVADDVPKKLANSHINFLKSLSKQIVYTLEQRLKVQLFSHESARIDMIIKNAGIGTWDWNLVNNDVRFDSGWCGMLGYTTSELDHRLETWDRLCHPEDKAQAYKDISDYLAGIKLSYENVHRLMHKSGEWVYILDRGSVIHRDSSGKPLQFAGTHTDITTQKQTEILESYKDRLRDFYIKKQIDKKEFFNFLLSEIIEITRSEYGFVGEVKRDLEGNPFLKTYALTDISWNEETKIFFEQHAPLGLEFKNLNSLFGKVLKSGEVLITNDAPNHPNAAGIPEGHPPLNQFMGLPIYGHGKFIGMIGVANAENGYSEKKYMDLKPYLDVVGELIHHHLIDEELKSQQNAALHESKLVSLGVLAAGIGHEINNPLTIIHGNLDRLLKKIERNEVSEQYLKKAHDDMFRALVRVENLIRGLRTFSRKDSIISSPVSILELVQESVEMLFQIYRVDGILIDKKFNIDKNTKIMADRGKIQQILVNLMNNARDVLLDRNDGKITVSIYENNEKVIMAISDNGPGMPREIQDKIFDPFFTTKEVNKGTGLGLSVVADIVRLHGAKITFESSKNGTSFYLEFIKL